MRKLTPRQDALIQIVNYRDSHREITRDRFGVLESISCIRKYFSSQAKKYVDNMSFRVERKLTGDVLTHLGNNNIIDISDFI